LDVPVQIYPWDESIAESVYEGSWVISKTDKVMVEETKQIIEINKLP